jgi:hypothetical protein
MPWTQAQFNIRTVTYTPPSTVTIDGSGFDGTELVVLVNGATALDLLSLMQTGKSAPQRGVIECTGKAEGGVQFQGTIATAGAKPGAYAVFMLQINQEKLQLAAAPTGQTVNL